MHKISRICVITFVVMFFGFSYGRCQNGSEKRLLLIGGIPEYDLPEAFEGNCSKLILQKAGADMIMDVLQNIQQKLSLGQMKEISINKKDTSIGISPSPLNTIAVKKMYDSGPMSVVPAEFYIFDKQGGRTCEFNRFLLPKSPKFDKNQKGDLSQFSSICEYLLVVWPIWWHHCRTETSTVNENSTYWMVAYALFDCKSNELLLSDYETTINKGKSIEYDKMLNNLGKDVSGKIFKYFKK